MPLLFLWIFVQSFSICFDFRAAFGTLSYTGPLSLYRSLVEEGKLQHDLNQQQVASELEDLLGRLEQYEKDMEEYHVSIEI